MSSLAVATPQKQHRGHPCAVCGVPSTTGTMVPMLGWVGPTCARKFAALERTFERDGLTEFLDGPVTFEPVESGDAHGISQYDFPQHILEMRAKAEKLGFNFEWHWVTRFESATCRLTLPRSGKLRRRLFARLEREQMAVTA